MRKKEHRKRKDEEVEKKETGGVGGWDQPTTGKDASGIHKVVLRATQSSRDGDLFCFKRLSCSFLFGIIHLREKGGLYFTVLKRRREKQRLQTINALIFYLFKSCGTTTKLYAAPRYSKILLLSIHYNHRRHVNRS